MSEGGVIGCERSMILIWLGYQVDNLSNSAIKLCSETRLSAITRRDKRKFQKIGEKFHPYESQRYIYQALVLVTL